MKDTVIVAVNGGSGSDAALRWALQWTSRTGQELAVCTIVDSDFFEADIFSLTREQVLRRARADVQRFAPHARPVYQIHRGRPAEELIEMSRHASMLVVGAHKADAISGLFHGTLPFRVADRASCPVVVVPSGWDRHEGRVVLGIDYETDDLAVPFAVRAAGMLHEPLEAVHTWQPAAYATGDYFSWFDYAEEANDAKWNLLHALTDPIVHEHPEIVVNGRVVEGRASDVILREARSAQLVVVGTHHRRAFAGMMLGSVSHDLLVTLPCPIAVVPTSTRRAAPAGVGSATPVLTS